MNLNTKDRNRYRVWTSDTIRYSDLDPNNHVNNGAMNEYFEDGRVRLRQTHFSHLGQDTLSGFVIARCSVEYYLPLHFPGIVEIGSVVSRIGRTSYTLIQAVFVKDRCYAVAEVITVLIDPETTKPVPIKTELRTTLEEISLDA